mgnify:CR=1 FL=1
MTSWDNMLIFYTTAENPIPLETDEALRLEATHKAMKRSWLSVHIVLGVLFLLNIIFYIADLVKQPLTVIADGNALFRNALFAVVLPAWQFVPTCNGGKNLFPLWKTAVSACL